MVRTNSIVIRGSLIEIFSIASDLPRWPEFLSHYRYNRYLSQTPSGGLVMMSCVRSGIPTTWVSDYRIDPARRQLVFEHRKSALNATRGMHVVWNFEQLDEESVRVTITHEHRLGWPLLGRPVGALVVGWFFIHHIATATLAGLKRKIESESTVALAPGS